MKAVLIVITAIFAQGAVAGDLFCGVNIESVAGSQVFNKSLFWEKTDITKSQMRFLVPDGSVVKADGATLDHLSKVVDGSLAMSISFVENRPQLFLAIVKRDDKNQIGFTNLTMASSTNSSNVNLLANGAAFLCREL